MRNKGGVFMKLEELKMAHVEECIDLYIDTFSKEPWNDVFESKDKVRAYYHNFLKSNQCIGYVGLIDNKIEVMSIGMIKPWIEGLEYYIDEFCVSYNSQGKGYGSQFLELVDADIKSRGMNAIILNTSQDVPAYDFYLKNGFTADEELRILYR